MRVYLLVLLIAATATYMSVPIVRHIALVSHALTPVRDRDVHTAPIPRLGGVAMFVGLATAIAVASRIPYLASTIDASAGAVVIGAGLVCLLGVVDDLWELDWMTKLAGQILAAGVMASQGVQLITFPVGGLTIGSSRLSLAATVLVIIVVINAVNFVDGLDGLAAGIIGIGATAFFIYVYILTRATSPQAYTSLAATVMAALIGVCLGFLPHNFNPATIFMGDSGSMQLGLVSAAGTIIVTGQIDPGTITGSSAVPVFLPLILPVAILLLPLTDMIMAITRRTLAGKSPFHPDKLHLHHRLLAGGYSHRQAVLTMYLWAAIGSFSVVALAILPWQRVACGALIAVIIALALTTDVIPGIGPGARKRARHQARRALLSAAPRRLRPHATVDPTGPSQDDAAGGEHP